MAILTFRVEFFLGSGTRTRAEQVCLCQILTMGWLDLQRSEGSTRDGEQKEAPRIGRNSQRLFGLPRCRSLFLRRRRRGSRLLGRCLRCGGSTGQHGTAESGSSRGHDCERERSDHEDDCGPCGRFGKRVGRRTGPKGSLAALPAESGRDIGALAALQQHNRDQKQTNGDVYDSDQYNHALPFQPARATRR